MNLLQFAIPLDHDSGPHDPSAVFPAVDHVIILKTQLKTGVRGNRYGCMEQKQQQADSSIACGRTP